MHIPSYFESRYQEYDKNLRLVDFTRRYHTKPAAHIPVTEAMIEEAFAALGKNDPISRMFNCGACGSDSCRAMAVKIAKKVNTPWNCIQKARNDMRAKHASIQTMKKDLANIRNIAEKIVHSVTNVNELVSVYESTAHDIERIASNIHMISLNASIETARAGDHGRSFAVVAEAIRNLAGETQDATGKITKSSTAARDALEGISGMVTTVGKAIVESHNRVRKITADNKDMQ